MSDRLAAIRSRTLAAERGLPYVELGRIALAPQAIRSAPFEVLEHLQAVPFAAEGRELHVAFAEPTPERVAELERVTGRTVLSALATADEIGAILDVRRWPGGGTHVALEWRPR